MSEQTKPASAGKGKEAGRLMHFDKRITLGNLLTIGGAGVALLLAYSDFRVEMQRLDDEIVKQSSELSSKIEMTETELRGEINTRAAGSDANMRAIRSELAQLSVQLGQLRGDLRDVLRRSPK